MDYLIFGMLTIVIMLCSYSYLQYCDIRLLKLQVEDLNKAKTLPNPQAIGWKPGNHSLMRCKPDVWECMNCSCTVECKNFHRNSVQTFHLGGCPNGQHWTIHEDGSATCE